MKHILVPTDFSAVADGALPFAIELAKLTESDLTLLHVVNPTHDQANVNLENEIVEAAQGKLDEMKGRVDELFDGFTCHTVVVLGDEDKGVVEHANGHNVDLIVMGTSGASGLARVFGSNALSVMREANCGVLMIPKDAWLESLNRILFATDYHEVQNEECMAPLLDIATAFKSEIHLLHVDDNVEAVGATKASAAINLHYYLNQAPHEFSLSTNPDIKQGIEDYYDTKKMDMLALMPQDHSIFESIMDGSITEKLVLDARMPILAIKEL